MFNKSIHENVSGYSYSDGWGILKGFGYCFKQGFLNNLGALCSERG